MKRAFILIYILCSIFLSVICFLNYSDNIYNSVFRSKECVVLESPQSLNSNQFIDDLKGACEYAKASLLYTTIENASSKLPTYKIYTTSIKPNFIKISSNCPAKTISSNSYLTTNLADKNTPYYIFGSTLYSHFEIYDFSRISELELSHSKFYVNSSSADKFSSYLISKGYSVTQITDENRTEQSDSMIELFVMFILLTVFMFFCAICFAFSKRKNIVIKKANGYSDLSVFKTTFLRETLFLPLACCSIYLFSGLIINFIYKNTFFDYLKYSIKHILIYAIISVLLFIVACIFVQFKKNACEIRGYRPSKALYVTAVVFRVIVSCVIIWGLTCAGNTFVYRYNLSKSQQNFSNISSDYAVLSLNAGSVDFYNNSDEYTDKCKILIKNLSEQQEIVIVDSIEFIDYNDDVEGILYINSNYLKVNPIFNKNGKAVTIEDSISDEEITILIPENYSGNLIEQAYSNNVKINVIRYAHGQKFKTFNQYAGIEIQGMLNDPVVMLINDELLSYNAQSIIGEQFMLIKSSSDNPYNDVKEIINDCGLSNVILEAQKLETIFDVAVMNSNIKVFQYSIVSILYLFSLVLITIFETTVYYENNKKLLTVKKLHGYGFHAYKSLLVNKAITFVIISIISIVFGLNIAFSFLAVFIDLLIVIYCIHKLEQNSITQYLKGDF